MTTKTKIKILTLALMSVSVVSNAFAGGESVSIQNSFAVIENGTYKDPSNRYDLTQAIVQDDNGNIFLMDGANTDDASSPVTYSPGQNYGKFVFVQKGVINSETIQKCSIPTAQTQNPELCDPAYYDDSGALLLKQGDEWEATQTVQVLSKTSYLLGPIVNNWYRNSQPLGALDLATNLNQSPIVFVKE